MARVTNRHYAEELSWWYASPWALDIDELPGGGLMLYTATRAGRMRLWGATASAEEVKAPAQLRLFLTEVLYYHLHPRKAARAVGAIGMVCTHKELAAFIRQQRRKMAARPRMWVAR